jgi:adenylyltransferase/sulfurtransferase
MLTDSELLRYDRQLRFPPLGETGQARLKEAHVVVAGLGGLGGPAAVYLASAGVGKLTVTDSDTVEPTNLNRQILYTEEDVGREKATVTAEKLGKVNPHTRIEPVQASLAHENAERLVAGADVVIDALDNMETRLVLNAACVSQRIPLIHGGINGLRGEVMTILPFQTACLACIHRVARPGRRTLPIIGATAGLTASIQVIEAIKLLAGFGELLAGRRLYIDAESPYFYMEEMSRAPDCPVCGDGR